MKIGRNDLCPCGSGKKYKKCCLGKNSRDDLQYRRISKTQQGLITKIQDYFSKELGNDLFSAGINDFFLYDDIELDEDLLEEFAPVFWPWFFYNMIFFEPDIKELGVSGLISPNTTIAEMFLQSKSPELDDLEMQLLHAANRKIFSFYEVQEVKPGRGFHATDLFRGDEHQITDIEGSKGLQTGDIIYSLVISVQGIDMVVGNDQYKYPPNYKLAVLDFKDKYFNENEFLTNEELLDFDFEIRELYMDMHDALFERPQMVNTDGESLSPRTLYYDIDSPEDAFQALLPLCASETETEIRSRAELDEEGNVQKVQFSWSREGHINEGMDNTILGNISMDEYKMSVEVNSEQREQKVKEEISKRLGERAVYKVTDIISLESALNKTDYDSKKDQVAREDEELQEMPEVQEAIKGMLQKHWQGWMDEEIPALGDITPREAAKTPKGRERLLALFKDMERTDENTGGVSQKPFIEQAKKELGLMDF